MGRLKLRGRDLRKFGMAEGRVIGIAINHLVRQAPRNSKKWILTQLEKVMDNPILYVNDELFGPIAEELIHVEKSSHQKLRAEAVPYRLYGAVDIEEGAINQMHTALKLPIARKGALMPDAHYGYGLPIGGVLATENAVIPYGVGVDIGCRMSLSIYDMPSDKLESNKMQLKQILGDHTRFGGKEVFEQPSNHEVLDREEFSTIPIVRNLKDKAWKQLGSSGGGNHFVEFGVVEIKDEDNEFDLDIGSYFGLLSHSGSRGLGATIAQHYTKLAKQTCPLAKGVQQLAWLDLTTEIGQEYWMAMTLAGDYASACHHDIHRRISKALGELPRVRIENHHNFAWKELVDGRELIVHRKGATPAGKGVLGIIPGSMTAPGFIVRGLGRSESICSASHGAGRQMSRSLAKRSFNHKQVVGYLNDHGVELIGGGLDEAPMAYKDINRVMSHQQDLVEILGLFHPRIVRMEG